MDKEILQNPLKRDETYQNLFICLSGMLLFAWFVGLILGDKNQFSLLYNKTFMVDFGVTWDSVKTRDPYNWVTGSMDSAGYRCYPPLAFLVFYLITLVPGAGNSYVFGAVLFILTLLFAMVLVYINVRANIQKKLPITLIFFFSVTTLGALLTGNIINLSAVLALIFLFGFDSENKAVREISYIALALSAGMKLYPALFGILILKRKRFKDAARTIIYGLFAFFIPFLFFEGGFGNIPLFLRNVKIFKEIYKYVDHSAFNFKYFANGISDLALRDTVYLVFIVIDRVLLVISMILVFFTKEKWREILLISVSIIWSTIHSGLYMGLFFFAGMVFFLNDAKKNVPNTLCCLCMALILNPLRIVMENGKDLSDALSNIGCSCLAVILIFEIIFEIFKRKKPLTVA